MISIDTRINVIFRTARKILLARKAKLRLSPKKVIKKSVKFLLQKCVYELLCEYNSIMV